MNRTFLSIGSNLDNTDAHLNEALRLLSEKIHITEVSSFYETGTAGSRENPGILSVALEGGTALSPEELEQFARTVEQRMRQGKSAAGSQKVFNIEILLYNDDMIKTETLTVPHPKLLERASMLSPLYEIAPGLILDGRYIREYVDCLKEKARKRPMKCTA